MPLKNKDARNAYYREWYKRNLEKNRIDRRKTAKKHGEKLRLQALQIVSGLENPVCVHCLCTLLAVLEINHKNGNGNEERRAISGKNQGGGQQIYRIIVNRERSTEDLEVTCKVCNTAHYVLFRYGIKYSIESINEK